MVAAEPLRGGLVRPEIPASYAVGGCFGPSEEEVLPS